MQYRLTILLAKYVLRPLDRLANDYRLITVPALALTFIAGIVMLVMVGKSNDMRMVLPCLVLFAGPLMLGMAIAIIPMMYEQHEHDLARNRKLALRLVMILETRGAMPIKLLQMQYNRHHLLNLPLRIDKLVCYPPTAHLFVYDKRRDMVAAAAPGATPRFDVPVDGDYQAAYYQAMARLHAIRTHPELITMQDSLIDDLYGIG